MILLAKYVVTVSGPVLKDGCVECHGGVIADVRRAGASDRTSRRTTLHFDDAVIVPGFVNAHTHLELSHLAGQALFGGGLIPWLEQLVERTVAAPPDENAVAASTREGVEQCLRAGVTCVGDITRHPSVTRPVLAGAGLGGVSFGEVIAIGRTRDRLRRRLDAAAECPRGSSIRAGISPHSPYTVEPAGLRACGERARALNLPLCIHLAESADEDAFTRSAAGPFRAYLERLGVWDEDVQPTGCAAIETALRCGVLGPHTVCAHLNYATDAELDVFARTGAHVAYCPRTHAAFDHPPHRFRDMAARGINVCIGTDSLASTPSLSVLEELRLLHRLHPDIAPATLIEMATLRGAVALGVADSCGSVVPGKRADLAVIPLTPGAADPLEDILTSGVAPTAVFLRGKPVIAVGRLPTTDGP